MARASQGHVIVGVILGMVILIIVAIVIYFFFLRPTGGTEGAICRGPDDCAPGFYCAGRGVCHEGESGGAVGAPCANNIDCTYGLYCIEGVCTNVLANLDPTSGDDDCSVKEDNEEGEEEVTFAELREGFTDRHLVLVMGQQKYYLDLRAGRLTRFKGHPISYHSGTLSAGGRLEVSEGGSLHLSHKASHIILYELPLESGRYVIFDGEHQHLLRVNPRDLTVQFTSRGDWRVGDFSLE